MQSCLPPILRKTYWILAVFSVLAYLATLALPRVDGHIIGSDGLYLYAYLPAVWLDGTLDMSGPMSRYIAEGLRSGLPDPIPITGMLPNVWPVGPALLWTPFFGVADLFAKLTGTTRDGYGTLYESIVCFGTVIYGLSGLWALARLLGKRYKDKVATLALAGVWCATNLPYYLLVEPSMGHALSFASTAWLLAYQDQTHNNRTLPQWVGLGGLVGLAALVRTQNVVLILLLASEIWLVGRDERRLAPALRAGGLSVLAACIVLLPQFVTWRIMYGHWALIPQGQSFMHWDRPMLAATLFSARHGLFLWHPIYALGLVGLVMRLRQRDGRANTIALLLVFCLQWYINAVADHWWADDSFGLRRFLSTGPILTLGLAELVQLWSTKLRGYTPPLMTIGILIVWNLLFVVQYRLGFIPMDQPLSWQQFVVDKFTIPFRLLGHAVSVLH